ncbi:hypothetical protein KY325_04315 [Candidatus Woesearchaeota archaeon]|nr:hypothetical protein [Candidatus Woesearchaeota archaeon]
MGEKYRKYKAAKESITNFKYVPGYENPTGDLFIFKDKVVNVVYTTKEPIAFLIDNKEVAENNKAQFEMLWDQETFVSKGIDALNTALNNYLDNLESDETFNVLGVTFGLKDYSFYKTEYKNAFKDIHQKRADKGIKAKLLFQQADPAMIEKFRKEVYNKNHEAKVLPFKTKFPVAILPSKNKTVMIIHKKEPSIITIDNKEASSAFNEYFDSMWQQDVRVYKGFEDVTTRFRQNMQELKEGDEYYVLGSALQYEEKTKLENFFMDYHAERVKRKIKVKLLAIQESYNVIYKELAETGDPQMKYAELKRLPPEFKYPMQITLYKGNKVSLISWSENLCFEVESKAMYDSFKANFDMLWSQEAEVFKGKNGVKALLNILLESGGKEHHTFGSTKESLMLGEDWWVSYHEKRAKKGVHAKLLFNESLVQWKAEIKYPNAEVRYTKAGFEPLTETIIKGDKVVIIIWTEEPTGFLINNKAVAESYDKFFKLLWEQVK